MAMTAPDELAVAHEDVVAAIRAIPHEALDWQPGGDDWSPKRISAHIANSYDFYVMVVQEVRVRAFGTIRLQRELAGWQAMLATDKAVLGCATVTAVRVQVERAYERLRAALRGLAPEDFDRPFVLYASWAPGAVPETATLRYRVLRRATEHLREHLAQLEDTLARWRARPIEEARARQTEGSGAASPSAVPRQDP